MKLFILILSMLSSSAFAGGDIPVLHEGTYRLDDGRTVDITPTVVDGYMTDFYMTLTQPDNLVLRFICGTAGRWSGCIANDGYYSYRAKIMNPIAFYWTSVDGPNGPITDSPGIMATIMEY